LPYPSAKASVARIRYAHFIAASFYGSDYAI